MRQEYDFRTAEERKKGVEEEEKAFDEMFNSDEPVYNKYVDFLLDLIPFKWGWKAKYWPSEIRWWATAPLYFSFLALSILRRRVKLESLVISCQMTFISLRARHSKLLNKKA